VIELIDGWLREVGTQRLVDGDKVRDMLLDLRGAAYEIHTRGADTHQGVAGEER
jgi:hypothetical protein